MKKTVKKTVKKVTEPKVVKESLYKATINVFGRNFTATGETAKDAIANLAPGNVRGRGILSIEKDGVKKDRILMPMVVLRLFNTQGISREIALKNASILFQGI